VISGPVLQQSGENVNLNPYTSDPFAGFGFHNSALVNE
jgi:hypothetical protein